MAGCAAQGDREDDAEDAALEEEDEEGANDGCVGGGFHAQGRADDAAGVGDEENPAGFEEELGGGGEEAACSEEGAADDEELEGGEVGLLGLGLGEGDLHESFEAFGEDFLRGHVEEHGEDAEGESTPDDGDASDAWGEVIGAAVVGEFFEVVVGGFGDVEVVEGDGEEDVEEGDAKVGPLDVDEGGDVGNSFEEDLFRQQGGDYQADGLDALRDVEAHFRVLERAAQRDEWVGGGF